jgi:hypothetical protein
MKRLIFVLLVTLLLLGTVACAKSGDPLMYMKGSENDEVSLAAPAPMINIPRTSPTPTVTPAGSAAWDGSQSVPADRMVIKSAYLALVVEDVSASMIQITNLAAAYGGFVINSDIQEEQNRFFANISFRVDSARFNEALQALRDLAADVRSESTSGEDVTEEYVDLGAKQRNLEASEAQ